MATITTRQALEQRVGTAALPARMKVLDHLDAHAARFLAASAVVFIAVDGGQASEGGPGLRLTVAGGRAGTFASAAARRLRLSRHSLDDGDGFAVGQGIGLLFLVPGLGATLRVNGQVARLDDTEVHVAVDEVYLHCAKALNRAAFWKAAPREAVEDVIADCRFLVLATADGDGHVDVSPRGDAPGGLLRRDGARLLFADRPGNRRTDSLHNLLTRPTLTLLSLVPGATTVTRVRGRGWMTHDPDTCAAFAVDGHPPLLVVGVDVEEVTTRSSAALARASLWPVAADVDPGLNPAEILAAHIRHNTEPSGSRGE